MTALSTDTLTITRAQEGSSARTIIVGDQIAATWTAKTLTDVETADYLPGGTDVAVADGGTGSSTASGARTNLGLAIGTNVQAWDADLDAIAALPSAADKVPYSTGAQAWALATLSSFARTLIDDADAGAALATLGASPFSGFTAGRYFFPHSAALTTTAGTLNRLTAVPFLVGKTTTFDRIAVEVTAFIASGLQRLGIYGDNGSGSPGSLVLDAGTVSTDTPNGAKEITISQSLTPGVYWLANVPQTASATCRAHNPIVTPVLVGALSAPGNAHSSGYYVDSVSGALPNPFGTPAAALTASGVRVYVRAA